MAVKRKLTKGKEIVYQVEEVFEQFIEEKASLNKSMARIKYIRVSAEEQNTARQETDKGEYDKVFIDKTSGKDTLRPQLSKMMEYVRDGDIVVVESYSRFARNTKDLLTLIEQLDNKGVSFISQKENIDTTTPQGRLMLTIFAGLPHSSGNSFCSVKQRV